MKKWVKVAVGGALLACLAGMTAVFSTTGFFDEEGGWTKSAPPSTAELQNRREERVRSIDRGEVGLTEYLTLRLALQNDPEMLKAFAAQASKVEPEKRPGMIRYVNAKYAGEPGVPCVIAHIGEKRTLPAGCPGAPAR